MKSLLVLAGFGLLGLLAGCSAPAAAPPVATPTPGTVTGDSLAAALGASGLPVVAVQVWTAETDVNKLLGRPGQYTGKVSWTDSRLTAPAGGTVEVFSDAPAMDAWFTYTDTLSKNPLLSQYIYRNDARLLIMRLSHELTPDQAAEYRAWLSAL